MNGLDPMLDLHAVAKILDINERTVWRRVASGALCEPTKHGGTARWFTSDIAKFQQALREARDAKQKQKNQ